MKTRITLIFAVVVLCCSSSVMAQGLLGKIVSGASKADAATTSVSGAAGSVESAVNTASQVGATVGKLKGLFGKKKNKEAEAAAAAAAAQVNQAVNAALTTVPAATDVKVTTVTVAGVDFATLKKLNESIKACANVQDTKMKFSATASTIEVSHKESTDNLLKLMQETSKDIFTEKNVDGLEDGKISLKLK